MRLFTQMGCPRTFDNFTKDFYNFRDSFDVGCPKFSNSLGGFPPSHKPVSRVGRKFGRSNLRVEGGEMEAHERDAFDFFQRGRGGRNDLGNFDGARLRRPIALSLY